MSDDTQKLEALPHWCGLQGFGREIDDICPACQPDKYRSRFISTASPLVSDETPTEVERREWAALSDSEICQACGVSWKIHGYQCKPSDETPREATDAMKDARRALMAIRLEVSQSIADDLAKRVEAAFASHQQTIDRLTQERDDATYNFEVANNALVSLQGWSESLTAQNEAAAKVVEADEALLYDRGVTDTEYDDELLARRRAALSEYRASTPPTSDKSAATPEEEQKP